MWTIREVTELTGLTRKKLRGYNDKGLRPPTTRDASGKWLYDDIALLELITIYSFTEAGYSRDEIKGLLKKPLEEMNSVYEEMISRLEEKRRRIDGMINIARTYSFVSSLPVQVQTVIAELGLLTISEGNEEKNITQTFSEYVDESADDEFDLFNEELGYLIYGYTILLGRLKTDDPANRAAQRCVRDLFNRYYAEVKKHNEQLGYETVESETRSFLARYITESVLDPDEKSLYDKCCKQGYADFIVKAIDVYMQNQDNKN